MTTFNLLSLLVGSATWITAFVGLLSLLTVRKQNRLALQPQLTPVRQSVKGEGNPDIKTGWTDQEAPNIDTLPEGTSAKGQTGSFRKRNYAVRIFNLGGGSAKNITAKWTLELDNMATQARSIAQKAFKDGFWEYAKNGTLSFRSKTGSQVTYFTQNGLTSYHDYILPCSTEHKGHEIGVPAAYMNLVSSLIGLLGGQEEFDKEEWNSFEDSAQAILSLDFEDISGNRYSVSFRFQLQIEHFSSDGAFAGMFIPQPNFGRGGGIGIKKPMWRRLLGRFMP
jgi:hypothetical protein